MSPVTELSNLTAATEKNANPQLKVFIFSKAQSPIASDEATISANLTGNLRAILSPSSLDLLTIQCLSPRVIHLSYSSTAHYPLSLSSLHQSSALLNFEKTHSVELVLQHLPSVSPTPDVFPIKLAVFDLDSTLIDQEVIDELARSIGALDAVAAITARAMAGELDFAESLKARVALLRGVRADVWEELKGRITFAEGARELCRGLKRCGVKMAVLSGGFVPIAEWVRGELGLDYARANVLEISAATSTIPYPHLTGRLVASHPIITASAKAALLRSIATENCNPLSATLSVGDGANDLEMLNLVGSNGGLGIAFRAKERVQVLAPNRLNTVSLIDLLYLMGHDERTVQELSKD